MTTYDERERGYEAAFAHDEDLRFRAHAHRDHQLGLWAAALLGKTDAEAESYAQSCIDLAIVHPGEDALAAKLAQDFADRHVAQSEEEIRRMMGQLLAAAVAELRAKP